MKASIKLLTTWLTPLILFMGFLWTTGCATQTRNPLEGWHFCPSQDPGKLDKAIQDDYQNYIQTLPAKEKSSVGTIHLFEDGNGQHAVQIEIGLNGTWWEHVLIYDKNNQRIKKIKYSSGHYRS